MLTGASVFQELLLPPPQPFSLHIKRLQKGVGGLQGPILFCLLNVTSQGQGVWKHLSHGDRQSYEPL